MSKEIDTAQTVYASFDQLFEEAWWGGGIEEKETNGEKIVVFSYYNLEFNNWLTEKLNWDGKADTYKAFLTKDFFLKFVQFKNEQKKALIAAFEKEKQSWKVNKSDSLNLIKDDLRDRFLKVEDQLQKQISRWKAGDDKIECAAFCELLFIKGYFFDAGNKRVSKSAEFALHRYGVDIEIQLQSSKKRDRTAHATRLKNAFARVV